MIQDPINGALKPINFAHLHKHLPEISQLDVNIQSVAFDDPIDSSNMSVDIWNKIGAIIKQYYHKVNGFVILHGSDTMSYTASALSFMLEGLDKPVILTGSQLPIGVMRTDGKENIITSIEIAAAQSKGKAYIQEVCIYFEYQLYRGNRTHKYSAQHFDAFISPNYPVLASAGVEIAYNETSFFRSAAKELVVRNFKKSDVFILMLFPGISDAYINSILSMENIKGLIVYSFGSGNVPFNPSISSLIKVLSKKEVLLLNITQCNIGKANRKTYNTNPDIPAHTLIDGYDLTLESAVAKMMYLLSVEGLNHEKRVQFLTENLRGEITII